MLKEKETQELSSKITSKLKGKKEVESCYFKKSGAKAAKIVPAETRDPSIESSKHIIHGITKVELVKPCKKKGKKRKTKSMPDIVKGQSKIKPKRLSRRKSTGTLKVKRSKNFNKKVKALCHKRRGKSSSSFKPVSHVSMYTEEESGLDNIQSVFSNIKRTIVKEESSYLDEESGRDKVCMTTATEGKEDLHEVFTSSKEPGSVCEQQQLSDSEVIEDDEQSETSASSESTLQLDLAQAFKNLYAAISSLDDVVEKANQQATDVSEPMLDKETQVQSPPKMNKRKLKQRQKVSLRDTEAMKHERPKRKKSPVPLKVIKDRIIFRPQGHDFIVRGYNCLQTFSQFIYVVNKLSKEGCTADITSSLMPFLVHENVSEQNNYTTLCHL